MPRLADKVAIVTGAGRGIGRAIALAFAAEGAKVVVASRSADTVQAVCGEIEAAGGRALGATCDVADKAQIQTLVARAVEIFGTVDILVNNAQSFGTRGDPKPYPSRRGVEDSLDEEWDYTLRTGLMATLWGMQAVFPIMKAKGGGKIINFGSMAGQRGEARTAPYNATKEAIRSLTRTAAREWGRYKINVNVINPAALSHALQAVQRDFGLPPGTENAAHIPLRRLGDPLKDIAPVAVFLASADSDYVTGMTVMADGGLLMGA
ncbi:MAG: SDR family NAD(P)-dependent oxidoreductase [Steroidobacteraceae bacterium]